MLSIPTVANEPAKGPEASEGIHLSVNSDRLVAVRGRANRFDAVQAEETVRSYAEELLADACPYADPYYWAGFQITGW